MSTKESTGSRKVKAQEVDKKSKLMDDLNKCPFCKSKLISSHLSDYRSLFIQEKVKCLDCGKTDQKKIHYIN